MSTTAVDTRRIRIHALGRFEIQLDGAPLRFASKAPRKPLELLKGLLTLRGRALSQPLLCDVLWPDLEALSAMRALHLAVFRLRHLLRDKRAVWVGNEQVALDAEYCWVDAWAFEQAETKDSAGLEQVLAMYHGPLLEQFEHPLVFDARERLRRKYVRAVLQLGQRYQQRNDAAAAIDLYESALGIESAAEDVHRALLLCLARDGQTTAAVAAYQRCRAILAQRYGTKPSMATEQIIREVLSVAASPGASRQVRTPDLSAVFLNGSDAVDWRTES